MEEMKRNEGSWKKRVTRGEVLYDAVLEFVE
jgi:hypothetical protein